MKDYSLTRQRVAILLLMVFMTSIVALAQQNVGIGTNSPDASSILELSSTDKGFLPPRLSTNERDGISNPVEGLIIYNTSLGSLEVFGLNGWEPLLVDLANVECEVQDSSIIDYLGTPGSGSVSFSADHWQSFTPTVTGVLASVGWTFPVGSYPTTAQLNIYMGEGTGGTLIHTQTETGLGQSVQAQINEDVIVLAGQKYTWQVSTAGGHGVGYNGSNVYSGGISKQVNQDVMFKVRILDYNCRSVFSNDAVFDTLFFKDGTYSVSNVPIWNVDFNENDVFLGDTTFGFETILGKYPLLESASQATTPRIFTVGAGSDASNRKSAITVLENGKVGINTDDPDADLEVQNDAPEIRLTDGAHDASASWNTIGAITFNTRDATNNGGSATDPTHTIGKIEVVAEPGGVAPDGQLEFSTGKNSEGTTIRMVIDHDGDVGIGTREPDQLLHLSGTAGTDGIKFPDNSVQTTAYPKTGVAMIIPHDFNSIHSDYNRIVGYGFQDGVVTLVPVGASGVVSGNQPMVAPVHLPQGANITEVKFNFRDERNDNLDMRLQRVPIGGVLFNNAQFIATGISTTNNSNLETITVNAALTNTTVDNSAYKYIVVVVPKDSSGNLFVDWTSATSAFGIDSVVITYTNY